MLEREEGERGRERERERERERQVAAFLEGYGYVLQPGVDRMFMAEALNLSAAPGRQGPEPSGQVGFQI